MRKTYKYRLYPTAAQITALEKQLGKACRLYSAALQKRHDPYCIAGASLTAYDQRACGDSFIPQVTPI